MDYKKILEVKSEIIDAQELEISAYKEIIKGQERIIDQLAIVLEVCTKNLCKENNVN